MRLTVFLAPKNGSAIRLPRAYRHYLQSAVYGLLSQELASFLHGSGFPLEKRSFKLFVFSRLNPSCPPRPIAHDSILFDSPLNFIISSPILSIMEECAQGLLAGRSFRLGNNELFCSGVTVATPRVTGARVRLRTCSPITCYSTLTKGDGHPYTVYHEPQESAFAEQIVSNLRKKRAALLAAPLPLAAPLSSHEDASPRETPLDSAPAVPPHFRPLGKMHRVTDHFSPRDTFPIKGWEGTFLLEGPAELLQLALDAGLGAKNSSGWGCVELAEEESETSRTFPIA